VPEYIAERFMLWIDFWRAFPSAEWWDRSYQTANALCALRAGGLLGKGLGLGDPYLVPLVNSDFIYAAIAEELGFIGSLSVILLYLSIMITGIRTAFHCRRRFDFFVVSAMTVMLSCQIIINIGGALNILPLTGVVLPLLSRSGFSLITFTALIGVIMAVSHKNGCENL